MVEKMKTYASVTKCVVEPFAKAGLFGGLFAVALTGTFASADALIHNLRN
jgi:hypothetical protein